MRKVLALLALPALMGAMLLAGGAAAGGSGGVARNQIQSATLTVSLEPAGYPGNIHVYNIIINPCDGTFTGSTSSTSPVQYDETIHGTLSGGNIDFTADYGAVYPGYEWYGTGPLGNIAGHDNQGGSWSPLVGSLTNVANVTNFKNHGDFVSANPNKNDAAHSCIGMPINSNQ